MVLSVWDGMVFFKSLKQLKMSMASFAAPHWFGYLSTFLRFLLDSCFSFLNSVTFPDSETISTVIL